MLTVLVLGCNSFSGSHFVKKALDKNIKVIGVSRSRTKDIFLPYKNSKNFENFKFYKYNINKDIDKIILLIRNYKIKHVVNFIAQGMVNESWIKPEDWYETNLISIVKLIHKIKSNFKLKKFLQISTPEVYGNIPGWTYEKTNFNPSTPYAISRTAIDNHLLALFKNYQFPVCFTRASNVYGPGQQLYRIIPKTIVHCLKNEKIFLHGGGLSKRSFIYIEDAVEAYINILKNGQIGETYHVSTNSFHSIKQVVNKTINLIDSNNLKLIKKSKDRVGKDFSYRLNSEKIRKKFKWKEKHSFEKGLENTINWVLDNFKVIKNLKTEYIHKS